MKHHPYFRDLLSPSAERLAYGARVLTEGGLQSIPKLNFPGGALIGCAAGFVNVAKIKGTHNAMKSGMLAAEAAYDAVVNRQEENEPTDLSAYDKSLRESWVWKDLYEVRNLRPSFNTGLGLWGGILYSGIDSLLLKGRVPWTFKHHKDGNEPFKVTSYSNQHQCINNRARRRHRMEKHSMHRIPSLRDCTSPLNIPHLSPHYLPT